MFGLVASSKTLIIVKDLLHHYCKAPVRRGKRRDEKGDGVELYSVV